MSYAIAGLGKPGQALARAFARKNVDVTVANRRPPEALTPEARAIGPTVVARSLRDALGADTIILAVPFEEHREVAKALSSGKARQSSTPRTRSEFSLMSWTVSCPPPSLRSPSPALRS